MTFTNTGKGTMKVTCNGHCGTELHQTPENMGVNLLDFMRSAEWAVGPNLCPKCQDGTMKAEAAGMVSFRKDAWDNVVELSPGIWVEAPPASGRDTPGQARPKRRRKIRKLL